MIEVILVNYLFFKWNGTSHDLIHTATGNVNKNSSAYVSCISITADGSRVACPTILSADGNTTMVMEFDNTGYLGYKLIPLSGRTNLNYNRISRDGTHLVAAQTQFVSPDYNYNNHLVFKYNSVSETWQSNSNISPTGGVISKYYFFKNSIFTSDNKVLFIFSSRNSKAAMYKYKNSNGSTITYVNYYGAYSGYGEGHGLNATLSTSQDEIRFFSSPKFPPYTSNIRYHRFTV